MKGGMLENAGACGSQPSGRFVLLVVSNLANRESSKTLAPVQEMISTILPYPIFATIPLRLKRLE